jgi:pimeloyl-ACP methyl ester carboxylesterase
VLDLLRHDADIGLIAADVAEPVVTEPITKISEQADILLPRDFGSSPSTAAASSAAEAAATAHRHSTAAAAGHPRCATSATRHAPHAGSSARRGRGRRAAGRYVHRATIAATAAAGGTTAGPIGNLCAIAAEIPNSALVIIPKAYHAFTLEKGALTADLLARFAENVLAGTWQGNKAVWIAPDDPGGELMPFPAGYDHLRAIPVQEKAT